MRIAILLVLATALTLGLAASGWPAAQYRNGDFFQFFAGAHAIADRASPYDADWWIAFHQREGSAVLNAPPQPASGPPAWTTPYPLWTFILALPLALLPFSFGAAAWLVGQLIAAGIGLAAAARGLLPERRDRLVLAGLAVSFQPLWLLPGNGNLTGFLVGAFSGAVGAALAGRPFLAGALAAVLIAKPQSYLLAVPALWLVVPREQRRRAILGALAVALPLIGLSFLLDPGWFTGWTRSAGALQSSSFSNATVWTLHRAWGAPAATSVALAVGLLTAVALWCRVRRPNGLTFLAVALPLSVALAVHGWTYEQLPILLSGAIILGRAGGRARIPVLLALAAVLVALPWGLYVLANARGGEEASVLVPLAVAALAAQSAMQARSAMRAQSGIRMSRRTGSSRRADSSSSPANRRS